MGRAQAGPRTLAHAVGEHGGGAREVGEHAHAVGHIEAQGVQLRCGSAREKHSIC